VQTAADKASIQLHMHQLFKMTCWLFWLPRRSVIFGMSMLIRGWFVPREVPMADKPSEPGWLLCSVCFSMIYINSIHENAQDSRMNGETKMRSHTLHQSLSVAAFSVAWNGRTRRRAHYYYLILLHSQQLLVFTCVKVRYHNNVQVTLVQGV
jgi:hypothetical protein